MNKIAVLAATAVLAVVGGSTAAYAHSSSSPAPAGHPVRAVLGSGEGPGVVRSGARGVPVGAGDDHRRRAAEPGDDRGNHVEPGDDRGAHVEPGDDRGDHVEPGDDRGHGRHGEHGSDD